MPKASARPDWVSPAKFRIAMRVSGCSIAAMVLAAAGAFTLGTPSVHAGAGAALFFGDLAVNGDQEGAMTSGARDAALAGEGVSGPAAADATNEVVSGFHASNVASCYTSVNNLYQTRLAAALEEQG